MNHFGDTEAALAGSHDSLLVMLSIAIAVFASYTALDLGGRIRAARGLAQLAWLGTAAVAMGGGIWSMHFVAMLAFVTPWQVTYDYWLTLLSLFVAIFVTGVGFVVSSQRTVTTRALIVGGVVMGLGVSAMHYTGMAAMRMSADLRYDKLFVALSVLIAVGAAVAALWFAYSTRYLPQKLMAAALMGVAISGMHYTGMQAAIFTAQAQGEETNAAASLGQINLALGVATITFVILGFALIASIFDRRFAVLAEREAMALRESEERFRTLFRNSPLPLHALDPDGRIQHVSDAWLQLLGYARADVIGRPLSDFMTPESGRLRDEVGWPSLVREGEKRDWECQFLRRSGEVLDILMSGKVERNAQGRFVRAVGGLVDVTARRRAEEELRQAQKMEAVGQLTGGVAHDFNNLLTVIMGNLELLQNQLDPGRELDRGRLRRGVENAMQGAQRAASLTQRLLAFSRRQPLAPQVLDVNRLIREMALLLARAVGDAVKLDVQLASTLWPVEVDPNQLEASIMNLAINARDAMPSGGVLTITTTEVDLRAGQQTNLPPGEYVLLGVSDSGEGMSEEVRARAFEPFFTTKIVGQGTGLGLSQVYGFVKQSGGHADIVSAHGKGTTVFLYLPRTHAEVEAARDMGTHPAAEGAGESILVVEDEEQVRAYAVETLRALNYATREAGDAVAALRMIEDRTQEIDLLLTDVVLPGLDGCQLAQAARRSRPALKVLFMSGYASAESPVLAGRDDGGADLIQKPLTRDVLAQRVRTTLDAASPLQARKAQNIRHAS